MTQCEQGSEEQRLGPLCVNDFGERYYYNLNRHGFDKVSAEVLFDTKFGKALFEEDALNVIIGTDSGLLLRYLQARPLPNGTRYLFIEPESVLAALDANGLLTDMDERMACIAMSDWVDAIGRFKITDYFYIDAVRSYNAICAQDDYIEEYAELSWHVTELLSQLHWQTSVELGAEAFIARQIHNIADNKLPAKLLAGAFAGKTVVLLAGGPSLDSALPWVRTHRDRLVVFAVSRIARQLLQADLYPDFIFSVDPTELSFDISKEMLEFDERTVFVCSHHTVPTLLNQWRGLALYLGDRLPWISDLNCPNLESVGPTVTNTALQVAYRFGFRRIVLAGVDLCFTRDGFTHAKGSNEALAGPRFNLTSLQVQTNAGGMAPTSCDFAQAIHSLALQARHLSAAGCDIVNVSEHAAKVDGIRYLALAELDLPQTAVDVADIVQSRLAGSDEEAAYYVKALTDLRRARFQIRSIAKLVEDARRINDAMYNEHGVIGEYKDKQKLDKIEKKLKREHRHYSRLVKKFGIRRFIKLAKPFNDQDWTAEEAKQLGNVFYDAYRDGAAKLLQLIEASIDRVLARQQELALHPDFSVLIAQARKDRSFGRVRLWRRRFAAELIPAALQHELAELDSAYLRVLHDRETRHFVQAKGQSSLQNLRQRAGMLFKHQKVEELADLRNSLRKHSEPENVAPYQALITGYLAELARDHDAALDAYRQIVDGGDSLLEEALARIVVIAVERDDVYQANLALECLSRLNPLYQPWYAEIQRLHGDILVAIDTYNAYIRRFPDDSAAQLKLARLYLDQGIYEAAELMLDHLLTNKPGLEAALAMRLQLAKIRADSAVGSADVG
ncbi:6-hydroxymethylpterin diphosphokinase MptE-like protein [Methylomonas sp. CM2]|uniref:motility associated factor glycosyltransferase family protein n=1 Tax=Methylomonas sp. CM2 TaxID=3417647 RepID=UPI003CF2F141